MAGGLVVAIAQQKGGAGKTTLAANLAVAWMKSGRRVAALDTDPQGSLSAWGDLRRETVGSNGIEVAAVTGWRVAAEVERRAREVDIVLIDGPPHAETDARVAVRAARIVVVPVQPSPMDVWATRPTLDLARQEKVAGLLVLNRVPPRASLTETMLEAIGKLGTPVAKTKIGNRVAFAAAMAEGRGIAETAPGTRAAAEISALAEEIWRLLAGVRR